VFWCGDPSLGNPTAYALLPPQDTIDVYTAGSECKDWSKANRVHNESGDAFRRDIKHFQVHLDSWRNASSPQSVSTLTASLNLILEQRPRCFRLFLLMPHTVLLLFIHCLSACMSWGYYYNNYSLSLRNLTTLAYLMPLPHTSFDVDIDHWLHWLLFVNNDHANMKA